MFRSSTQKQVKSWKAVLKHTVCHPSCLGGVYLRSWFTPNRSRLKSRYAPLSWCTFFQAYFPLNKSIFFLHREHTERDDANKHWQNLLCFISTAPLHFEVRQIQRGPCTEEISMAWGEHFVTPASEASNEPLACSWRSWRTPCGGEPLSHGTSHPSVFVYGSSYLVLFIFWPERPGSFSALHNHPLSFRTFPNIEWLSPYTRATFTIFFSFPFLNKIISCL